MRIIEKERERERERFSPLTLVAEQTRRRISLVNGKFFEPERLDVYIYAHSFTFWNSFPLFFFPPVFDAKSLALRARRDFPFLSERSEGISCVIVDRNASFSRDFSLLGNCSARSPAEI